MRIRGGVAGMWGVPGLFGIALLVVFVCCGADACNFGGLRSVPTVHITGNSTATVGEPVRLRIFLEVADPSGNAVAADEVASSFAWTLCNCQGTTDGSVDWASVGPSSDDPASAVFVATRAGHYAVMARGLGGRATGGLGVRYIAVTAPAIAPTPAGNPAPPPAGGAAATSAPETPAATPSPTATELSRVSQPPPSAEASPTTAPTPAATPGCTWQVAGTWKVSQDNGFHPTFVISQTDAQLQGSATLSAAEAAMGGYPNGHGTGAGSVNGDNFTFTVTWPKKLDGSQKPGTYAGKITEREIRGDGWAAEGAARCVTP